MAKRLLQLTGDLIQLLRTHSETGMGFYVVKGRFSWAYVDSVFVIGGSHCLLPLTHPEFFSVADLLEGVSIPPTVEETSGFVVTSSAPSRHAAPLPSRYKPQPGCVPLIGSVTLSQPTVFCRYLAPAEDARWADSMLPKGTYLATRFDLNDARTGFAAVARYALPLPIPASHVFEYELPSGTHMQIGTAFSCFGQAGGGVEVRLTAQTPATPQGQRLLADI